MTYIAAPSHNNTSATATAVRVALDFLVKPLSLFSDTFPAQDKPLGKASSKLTLHVNPNASGPAISSALAQLNDVRTTVFDLVKRQEWLALAGLLQDWDQSRSAANDGTRFARHALFAVADAVSDGKGLNGMPSVSDATVEQINAVLATNPDCYSLAAISAYLRVCQAWNQNAACERRYEQAAILLKQYDAECLNSPLLAGIACDALALVPAENGSVKQSFVIWANLDTKDQVPFAEYKYFQLAA